MYEKKYVVFCVFSFSEMVGGCVVGGCWMSTYTCHPSHPAQQLLERWAVQLAAQLALDVANVQMCTEWRAWLPPDAQRPCALGMWLVGLHQNAQWWNGCLPQWWLSW